MSLTKIFSVTFLFTFLFIGLHQQSFSQSTSTSTDQTSPQQTVTNGNSITITGEVVCSKCYSQKGSDATGASHKECAMSCAKNGTSLAILTSDGSLYYPVTEPGKDVNALLIDHIADQVQVQGTYTDRADGSKGITITSVTPVTNKN